MSRQAVRVFVSTLGILLVVVAGAAPAVAQAAKPSAPAAAPAVAPATPAAAAAQPAAPAGMPAVTLPEPRKSGGKPLLDVLAARHSTREYATTELPPQVLSDLLWAAFGINRPDGKRTAPSAMNWQEIDVYVATATGIYRYDAKANALVPVVSGDQRAATGMQPFVPVAPVNLVYVADNARATRANESDRQLYEGADTAFIAENVYLFCASEGLATVVRGSIDRAAMGKLLQLRPEQHVILAQTVGYPK